MAALALGAVVVVTPAELAELVRAAVREVLVETASTSATPAQSDWLTAEDASTLLAVTPRTIGNLAKRGDLPCSRVGRLLRFRRVDVLAYLNRR